MKYLKIYLLLILLTIISLGSGTFLSKAMVSANSNNLKRLIELKGGSDVQHIDNIASLDSILENEEKLIVVDFSATWCMPCKMIAPAFDEMSLEFSSSCTFVKVDVDETPDIASRYQVMAMPTFLFIKKGQVVGRFSGASVEKLRETINSLI